MLPFFSILSSLPTSVQAAMLSAGVTLASSWRWDLKKTVTEISKEIQWWRKAKGRRGMHGVVNIYEGGADALWLGEAVRWSTLTNTVSSPHESFICLEVNDNKRQQRVAASTHSNPEINQLSAPLTLSADQQHQANKLKASWKSSQKPLKWSHAQSQKKRGFGDLWGLF